MDSCFHATSNNMQCDRAMVHPSHYAEEGKERLRRLDDKTAASFFNSFNSIFKQQSNVAFLQVLNGTLWARSGRIPEEERQIPSFNLYLKICLK